MAVAYHALSSDLYYDSLQITASTDKRDVSEMLDLWAHKDTPFLNRISWGPDSGGLGIEWLSEHLGWGYIENVSTMGSASVSWAGGYFFPGSTTSISASLKYALNCGALLYLWNSTDAEDAMMVIESIGAADSICLTWVLTTSLEATQKLYILGELANEGSVAREDTSRPRTLLSNSFSILRKDIRITGSMAATDMHAVPEGEVRHQLRMRLLEMQRDREMHALFGVAQTRSATLAGSMNGVLGFLRGQSGTHIDTSTTSLTETAFNNLVAAVWDNRGNPDIVVGSQDQIRKFTGWDRARVRVEQDSKIAGFHVTKYLTDIGIEVDLIPMRKFPVNTLFVLDSSKIKLRAKKGRKLFVERMGVRADAIEYQMLSEFSGEVRGYDLGWHGYFGALS
ncbi:MAG: SU10 major capsid protein [Candidatus Thorarchaeota archaeon]|jgi:hypothetical protein